MDSTEDLDEVRPGRMEKERLSGLDTSWTMIRSAHSLGPAGQAAMRDLIGRYHDAIERYIRLKIRDGHLADEVLQEFWHKLLTHKLAGADETKGRFRDYLRTVLHRLMIDHFRARKLQPLPPGELVDPEDRDQDYDRIWRETLISKVWSRLETFEATTPKNRYATVLRMRVANSDRPIEELSAELGAKHGTRVTPEAFRKTLQRARTKYLEMLIEELRATIHPASQEDIEAEINDLGLGNLYRKYSAAQD
jgi:RNA polymerase sigma-70 factor (ECF subfamily)